MADRVGLGILGYVLCCVTVVVTLVALTVVMAHVDGSLALEAAPAAFVALG
jgi:hypothetical protein